MANADTDYNPAIRREIKADAETGRTFKKWKHRAQGAAVGAGLGAAGAILGRRALVKKGFASVRKPTQLSFIESRITELSLHGGFKDMLESSVKLRKIHSNRWREMTPKEREHNRAEMRVHRDAINDQERAADNVSYGPSIGFVRPDATTNLGCLDVMKEKHPALTPMDPEELKRKKLNAGQTCPQEPLLPQPAIERLKGKLVHMSGEMRTFTNLGTDGNGRPHSAAGTFEPDVDGINPAMVRKAYSPTERVTGRSPFRKALQKTIATRALARVAKLNHL